MSAAWTRRARTAVHAHEHGTNGDGRAAEHHLRLADAALRICTTAVEAARIVDEGDGWRGEHLAPDRRLSLEAMAADAGQYAAAALAAFTGDVRRICGAREPSELEASLVAEADALRAHDGDDLGWICARVERIRALAEQASQWGVQRLDEDRRARERERLDG